MHQARLPVHQAHWLAASTTRDERQPDQTMRILRAVLHEVA